VKKNYKHSNHKSQARKHPHHKKSLRLIKVDEGKCKDEIGIPSLFGTICFMTKASKATFATNPIVLRVRNVI
jgi:hypothetical protein